MGAAWRPKAGPHILSVSEPGRENAASRQHSAVRPWPARHRNSQGRSSEPLPRFLYHEPTACSLIPPFSTEEFVIKNPRCWGGSHTVLGEICALWGPLSTCQSVVFISILISEHLPLSNCKPAVWNSWLCCVFTLACN